ncbi:cupin domain-containing protein [Paenibacillus glycinis]|nr:cupin domain-containing protein [Paenibacillus glycinis]
MHLSTYFFEDDGRIPNNPVLPALVYAGAFRTAPHEAEATFNRNDWRNGWVNGVYAYHHYHGNSHEALAVLGGSALLMIGGENGNEIEVQAGDVLVLPAGTGHKLLRAGAGFSVAGAYPGGMSYNTRTGNAGERQRDLEDIRLVPLPDQDPVFGREGPLLANWKTK